MDLSKGLAIAMLLASSAPAQKTPPELPATGTVTGHVTCADTQLPARFATVSLVRRPSAAEIEAMFAGDGLPARFDPRARKPGAPVDLIGDTTDLNGAYAIRQVPPGDYWVVAKMKGYMIPVADATDAKQESDLDSRMAAVPLVHVAAERTSTADVSLRKGGVVAGQVRFEDGSPAPDVSVWPVQINKRNMEDEVPWGSYGALDRATDSLLRNGNTDDEGRYRMAGLPPGRYLLKIYLKTKEADRLLADGGNGATDANAHTALLKIYSPGVFRLSDARQIEIKGDDVVRDADVTIDLTVLHSIRGRVMAKEDQHALPRFSVRLGSETDASLGFNGTDGGDGTFSIDCVPAGTYTLTVERAADTVPDETQPFRARIAKQYEAAKLTVVVGEHDVALDDILLAEKKPEAKDAPR